MEKRRKERKRKKNCALRWKDATACMQINAFLYLPNSQYTLGYTLRTWLAGGTVKSENDIATILSPVFFLLFVSLVNKSLSVFGCLSKLCLHSAFVILLLLVSISFKLNCLRCYKSILIF